MAFYQLKFTWFLKESIGPFQFLSNKDGRIPAKRLTIFKQYKEEGQTL